MAKPNPFTNRIIGYGTKPADQFQANPHNYRTHPQRQRDAVQASLRELGWIGVVVENVTTGQLIDGHERVWQALANNEEVPYIQVELSEEQERLALAIFDPITYMAETDAAILDALLRDVNTGEAALQELLAGLAEDAALYGDAASATQDAEATEPARATLAARFILPPFSVLDARQGYWQERKRAWIALGIQSELGRGENLQGLSDSNDEYRYNKNEFLARIGRGPLANSSGERTLGAIAPNQATGVSPDYKKRSRAMGGRENGVT